MIIRAIASHTFREAIRKKILHVLIGLGILIMVASCMIPIADEPNARIRMVLTVFFQVVVFLCITGIIFLSATSLPSEIEDKTIYGILSKPVSRLKIVIGKIMGFALLSGFILVTLCLLHIIVLQQAASGLPEKYKGILKARSEFAASQFFIQGNPHHVRGGIVWIEGGRTGVAVWNFSDIFKKLKHKSYFEIEFSPKVDSSRKNAESVPLVVKIEDNDSGLYKTEVLPIKADEPLSIKIDAGIVRESSRINISIFPLNKTDYLGVTRENARLFLVERGFLLNYGKAVVITFLKFLLIVTIAVMGSAYLSAPVSIVAALVVFLCGHILDFIKDFSFLIQCHDLHEHDLPSVIKGPNILLVYTDAIARKVLVWFSVILPDFKKYDSLEFLLKGINIPLETLGILFGYTALYAGVCLFISFILFKKREFF